MNDSDFWFYDEAEGAIVNKNRSFFAIKGLQKVEDGKIIAEQPVLLQQEIGYLGIICKKIDGIMIYFVGLTYAELTTAMPKCGGEHIFSYKAFGPIGSFICTWAIILSYFGVVCFEACSLPIIIQFIFPGFLKGYLYTIAGFDIYLSWLVVAMYILPGTGCTLTSFEWGIALFWTVLGVIFAVSSKIQYKEKFGKIE